MKERTLLLLLLLLLLMMIIIVITKTRVEITIRGRLVLRAARRRAARGFQKKERLLQQHFL